MDVSIKLTCKPYVAHYLRQQHGPSIKLSRCTHHGLFFMSMLSRKHTRYDNRINPQEEIVTTHVSLLDAECFGFELTETAARSFTKMVEDQLKAKFLAHMNALVLVAGYKKASAIRIFYNQYGFSDEIWPFESLRKLYNRSLEGANALKAA